MSIALNGNRSDFAITADDVRAAQEALDAIADAPNPALYGGARAQLESIVNRGAEDRNPFDGGDPEDHLLSP